MHTITRRFALPTLVLGALLATPALLFADEPAPEQTDTQAIPSESRIANAKVEIKETLNRYALARYSADVETTKACVHHDVARRMVMNTYWGSPSPDWVRTFSHDMIAFLATDYSQTKRLEPEEGRSDVVVFDVAEFSASAMLVMDDIIELLHVVEFDGRWQIMDSSVIPLRTKGGSVPEPAGDADRAAIEQVCRDYCIGFYEIDADKVQGTCHPTLSKRTRHRAGGTDFDYLQLITHDEIWLLAKTFNRQMGFDAETSRCDIEIYYADEKYASAKMTGASWFDYFQLMKVNGEWQIVNIFYEALPEEEWSERETAG